MIRFGSVCSGIEAASVAWHPLGWKAAWLSEIEPFPSAVLAHHYPDVPNFGDMTLLPERILSGEVEAPDLFCGGTPCQAFSVAGLRNSLDDARGNLSLTFVGIANAIDHVRSVRSDAPAIVFWENVPGVLSTKDNAFGCFLGALAGESDPVTCPDGKWSTSGVVVGQTRTVAWRVLDAQYFGVAQRRKRVFVVASAREDFDPAAVLFEFDGVRRDTAPSRETRKVTPTISSSGTGVSRVGFNCEDEWFIETPISARMVSFGEYVDDGTASAMKARDYKDATDLVAQPISIHPHCIGRAPNAGPQGKEYLLDGSAYCMDSRGQPQAVAQPMVLMDQGGSVMNVEHDMVGTLRRETHGHEPAVIQPPSMAVRRLTPVECERLQGFPDGYTNIPWRKKYESPDGPRYKALGNSWAVPVVHWIGKRIQESIRVST
jgi:DNA (cytosine-5)-methyltransferase 1